MRGSKEVYEIRAVNLGELKFLTATLTNPKDEVYLTTIQVHEATHFDSISSDEEVIGIFVFDSWLSSTQSDGQTTRTVAAIPQVVYQERVQDRDKSELGGLLKKVGLEASEGLSPYIIHVSTGTKNSAGTSANAYVQLFGQKDQTGVINLQESVTHKTKFTSGQTDVFEVKCLDVGALERLVIGHDGAGVGAGWFIDKVEVECPTAGQRWVLPCGRWLAEGEDDGLLHCELRPLPTSTQSFPPNIPYEVKVLTGEEKGSSTDADVHLTLYGVETSSQQKSLAPSKERRKHLFNTGSQDCFLQYFEDVGKLMQKVRIGHDGSGSSPGWLLDSLHIRRLLPPGRTGSITHSFRCGKWLDKSKDDRTIVRELVAEEVFLEECVGGVWSKEPLESPDIRSIQYTLDVYTGDLMGSGTDANVFVTLFGEKTDSGERALKHSETNKNKFERKCVDRFKIQATDLGTIYKMKIRHDNSGLWKADWYLDRVEVRSADWPDTEPVLFHCERWLSRSKDDRKIERTLYAKGYEGDKMSEITGSTVSLASTMRTSLDSRAHGPGPGGETQRFTAADLMPTYEEEQQLIPYIVSIATGNEEDHGTTGKVFLTINGEDGKTTGRVPLVPESREFVHSSVLEFPFEAPDLGDKLEGLVVAQDGVLPDQAWFLSYIEINLPTRGENYRFEVGRWLGSDKDDGQLQREVSSADSSITRYTPRVPHELTVSTGDIEGAGTDLGVSFQLFGSLAISEPTQLMKTEASLQRGARDVSTYYLPNLGTVSRIRLFLSGTGSRKKWNLNYIKLTNQESMDTFTFTHNDWLKHEGKEEMAVDIGATYPGKDLLHRKDYELQVVTSDVGGAGTDANVSCNIFGSLGSSGELKLKKSNKFNKFERKQTDVIKVPGLLDLGQLYMLRIWHDNAGFKNGCWHLKEVVVKDLSSVALDLDPDPDSSPAQSSTVFPCNKWLSLKEADCQITRELLPASQNEAILSHDSLSTNKDKADRAEYSIKVKTASDHNAGTTATVSIILGTRGARTKPIHIAHKLLPEKTHKIVQQSNNITSIDWIKIFHQETDISRRQSVTNLSQSQNRGQRKEWRCEYIEVTNSVTQSKYHFSINKWIPLMDSLDQDGLDFKCTSKEESLAVRTLKSEFILYEVHVFTGDLPGAGTDSNVFITLFGSFGDSGKRKLMKSAKNMNKFETGKEDIFMVGCLDLGKMEKIQIEHDNAGMGAAWHLSHVTIVNRVSMETNLFPCDRWFDESRGDKLISRQIWARPG